MENALTQLAELFQRDKSVISRHIKNLFTEGELKQEAVKRLGKPRPCEAPTSKSYIPSKQEV